MEMTGDELRARIDQLGLLYTEAAEQLGLSLAGLHHQMRDMRRVSHQTEIILSYLEREKRRRQVRPNSKQVI